MIKNNVIKNKPKFIDGLIKLNSFLMKRKFEKENYDFKTFSASKQSDLLYAYGKEKLNKEETEKLEKLIYEDYLKSGNTRKWHKWIGE